MLGNLSGMHLVAILAIVLLLFGAGRLPALAKSVGQSIRVLKQETARDETEVTGTSAATDGPATSGTSSAASESGTSEPPASHRER